MSTEKIIPEYIRIDASSACQLNCYLCQAVAERKNNLIGRGMLKFSHFKRLLDHNPQIKRIELANWGEALLNKEMPKILEYAFKKGAATTFEEGANFNDVPDKTLESLVKYKTRLIRCAIDGVTNHTYQKNRIGGDLNKVIKNIQRINHYKKIYTSDLPRLIFQFVIFDHNVHEIDRVVILAKMLGMEPTFKLNALKNQVPSEHQDIFKKYTGYINRKDYLKKEGTHYMRKQCYELWKDPQINWDGKLLGCSRNTWQEFGPNVFEAGLIEAVNSEKMSKARQMIQGKIPPQKDLPCTMCSVFKSISKTNNWVTLEEIEKKFTPLRNEAGKFC